MRAASAKIGLLVWPRRVRANLRACFSGWGCANSHGKFAGVGVRTRNGAPASVWAASLATGLVAEGMRCVCVCIWKMFQNTCFEMP